MKNCIADLEMNHLILSKPEASLEDNEIEVKNSDQLNGSYISFGFDDGNTTKPHKCKSKIF